MERPENQAEQRTIEGHAAVFNEWSETLGLHFPYQERVLPGAFRESIHVDDVRALFNHDPNYVLGRNTSGTLQLEEDEKGLKVRIYPPDTQWARDLMTSIDRGDINQMSFGFVVEKDHWGVENERDVRSLEKVRLFDVSPVTYPAYRQTDVGVRSMQEVYKRHRHHQEKQSKERNKVAIYKQKLDLLSKA